MILHVVTVVSLEIVGVLIGFQMTVAILSYHPAAAIAEKVGKRPVVIVTFLCFSIYPAAIIFSQSFVMLLVAYFIAGFREFGEPARKAMIVDRADSNSRGENVVFYYTLRSFSIIPASTIGAILWVWSPILAGLVAGLIGLTGLFVFSVYIRD
ncbi:MAG: MFS transporter [Candidatus Thorarchaeota archaeon]